MYTLDWFLQASNEGLLPPQAISWGEDEARGAFAGSVRRSSSTASPLPVSSTRSKASDLGEGWGVVPSPTQGDGNQISNARTWAVTSGSENPYEAMLADRHVGTVDQSGRRAAGGSVPMRNSVALADPRLDEIWPFFDDNLRAAYSGSDSVPAGLNGGEVELVLEELFGEIVVGTDKTAQELADEVPAEARRALDQVGHGAIDAACTTRHPQQRLRVPAARSEFDHENVRWS